MPRKIFHYMLNTYYILPQSQLEFSTGNFVVMNTKSIKSSKKPMSVNIQLFFAYKTKFVKNIYPQQQPKNINCQLHIKCSLKCYLKCSQDSFLYNTWNTV